MTRRLLRTGAAGLALLTGLTVLSGCTADDPGSLEAAVQATLRVVSRDFPTTAGIYAYDAGTLDERLLRAGRFLECGNAYLSLEKMRTPVESAADVCLPIF